MRISDWSSDVCSGSEVRASEDDLDILDLIAPEDVVVTLSHSGYAKRQPVSSYRAQKRGGRGRNAAATKEEDFIDKLWLVNTHDTLLTFTSAGRVFWLPVHQLPDAGPHARGRPLIHWLRLEEGEQVQAVLPVREYSEALFVFFAKTVRASCRERVYADGYDSVVAGAVKKKHNHHLSTG